jgi:[ribosomal protein S18]-alanine N-acetyltransferase
MSGPSEKAGPLYREARPEDRERLWRLDRLCFAPGIAYSRRELGRFLDLPRAACLVAEAGANLCGFGLAYREPPEIVHLVTLDVHPDWRRQGVGRRLLESLLAGAAAAGARQSVLQVDVRNSGAIAFYRTFGFRRSGRLSSYYAPGLDAFEMSSDLSARPVTRSG